MSYLSIVVPFKHFRAEGPLEIMAVILILKVAESKECCGSKCCCHLAGRF